MTIVFDEDDGTGFTDQSVSPLSGKGYSLSARIQQAGRAIEEIEGVVSARVEAAQDGRVEEVHVVARGGRRAKEIVRDVETLLKAKFDLEIDHRKISVARLGDASQTPREPEVASRVGFQSVSLHLSREGGEAKVDLSSGSQRWVGRASSRGPESAWPRLVARATIDAVSQMLPPDSFLELADLTTVTVAERDAILVSLRYRKQRHSIDLMGCASMEDDVQRSVVYAVLHAMNRFLGRFSDTAQRELILEPPWDS
ncbi:MAG: hypothetical protein KAW17_09270 [Candidatus Eisenbacteria sp.]|nr:hypothetical protein [Candidatus Eisenbacteria bacterium]